MTRPVNAVFGDEDEDELCQCGEANCPEAKKVLDAALAKLEKREVELFCLSQGDQLSKDQVEQIFRGDIAGVEDYILTWWRDNDQWAIDYEVEQLIDSDEKDLLDAHDELFDELKDAIRIMDQSDPFGELAGATSDVWVRVWICDISDECWDDPDVFDWEINSILQTGGLRRDLNEATIRKFLQENQCCGEVCLLFRATVKDLIADVFGAYEWGSMPADPKLRITDPKLWIEGYSVQLQGQSSAALDMSTDPRLDDDFYQDRYMSPDTWEVVGRFDEYRQDILAFMEYRQKLLEKA